MYIMGQNECFVGGNDGFSGLGAEKSAEDMPGFVGPPTPASLRKDFVGPPAPQQSSGSSATDWAMAIPAAVSSLTSSATTLMQKQKPQKVVIQQGGQSIQQPYGGYGESGGMATWHWVVIGVGAVALLGATAYFIAKRKSQ